MAYLLGAAAIMGDPLVQANAGDRDSIDPSVDVLRQARVSASALTCAVNPQSEIFIICHSAQRDAYSSKACARAREGLSDGTSISRGVKLLLEGFDPARRLLLFLCESEASSLMPLATGGASLVGGESLG
jgi:hypothetical protein